MDMRIIAAVVAVVVIALFAFSGQQLVGGDKDKHGCIPTAGYTWCEAKQTCLRIWEEPCQITNFDECVAAGYPAMESHPRQCRIPDGTVFVEELSSLTQEDAQSLAEQSSCTEQGPLTGTSFYNFNTRTWWFDLDIQKEGCNPACVVSEDTLQAEINWRCTGALL